MTERRGLLIILSSPSGAGKSTLAGRLRDWDPSIRFSVSATTRPARAGEQDGRDYHFVDEARFKRMVGQGDLLEHAHVFGNWYGSPRAAVMADLEQGHDVLFDIDWQGAQQLRASANAEFLLSIFLLPPSIAELRDRLRSRAKDSEAVIAKRMERSWDEISHWDSYDYVLVNDDLQATEARIIQIVSAERMKRQRQPWLLGHVRKLQQEFQETS